MTEKDLDIAIEKCERIMEMDTRTMQNPVSENGWIFEKVYELLQYLRQFQFATDTNVGGNLIDRQAAISEIMEDIKDRSLHDDPATPEDYAEGYDEGIRNAAAIVLQMPSAQPGCEAWHKTIDEGFPSEGDQVLVTDGKYFWLDESVANDVGLEWESGQSLWERTEWAYFKDLHKKGKSK